MIIYLMSITKEEDNHIVVKIYEEYRNDMFFAAMNIVHNQQLAEDIVQESFERIIKKIHHIKMELSIMV